MTHFFRTRSIVLMLATWHLGASGQSVPPGTATNLLPGTATNSIQPTVTAAMGDRGGRFFGQVPDPARTRRYFIAAEPQLWDYTPEGKDPICGKPLPPPVVAQRKVIKLRYHQYTDDTFTTKVFPAPRLGLMGPVLRGNVGDFIVVTFRNNAGRPLSMHPHGVKYDKDSEGSFYEPKPGLGAAVADGARFTYVWHLDEDSGPRPDEPSSKGWLYHSHVSGDEESDLGLVGFIVVSDPKRARPDGTPADVDREMAALFMIHDESGVGAAAKEAAEYGAIVPGIKQLTWTEVQEKTEQGARHAINGYIFGNTPGLEMNEGERVRWYLFALGSESDFHTAHWHGMRVTEEGRRRTDVVELLPASMKVADMRADNPGTWLFHCHVADHMMEGMFARVVVHAKDRPGADRSPNKAFFGLAGDESLVINSAEATVGKAAEARFELRLRGRVSVYDAFTVSTQPFEFRLGTNAVSFRTDRRGMATTAQGTFRVLNASEYGVVYGEMLEFEAVIRNPDWMEAVTRGEAGGKLSMQIGQARHETAIKVQVKRN